MLFVQLISITIYDKRGVCDDFCWEVENEAEWCDALIMS